MPTPLALIKKRRSPTALPTILVVDAGAAFGLSLNRSLRKYGYDVRLATSADHAVRTMQARHIDFLIVHDEGAGRGRAALACIRGINRSLPSALITSDPVSEGKRELVDTAGPVAVFGKPLDLTAVIATIERALVPAEPKPSVSVCRIPLGDQKTRREIPRASDDRPTRRHIRAVSPTRRLPSVLDDIPEGLRNRKITAKLRALDAGEYSIVNRPRDVVTRCHPT